MGVKLYSKTFVIYVMCSLVMCYDFMNCDTFNVCEQLYDVDDDDQSKNFFCTNIYVKTVSGFVYIYSKLEQFGLIIDSIK